MISRTTKASILLICIFAVFFAGCGGQADPDVKKARLIATENSKLQKELADKDKQIEQLTRQHQKEMAQQLEKLEKCQTERDALQEKVKGQLETQVEGVLGSVMDQNKLLRDQVEQLQAELKELQDKAAPK